VPGFGRDDRQRQLSNAPVLPRAPGVQSGYKPIWLSQNYSSQMNRSSLPPSSNALIGMFSIMILASRSQIVILKHAWRQNLSLPLRIFPAKILIAQMIEILAAQVLV
jgi:hypothetical protein